MSHPDLKPSDYQAMDQRNLRAWDQLYGSTSELIWGADSAVFLADFLAGDPLDRRVFDRALDAGTGEGRNLGWLRRHARSVAACDGAAEALAKIPAAASAGVEVVCCELGNLPWPDGSFDFILLCDIVETLPDPVPVLRELRRVLAPGGVLMCNLPETKGDVAGVEMSPAEDDGFWYRRSFYYRFPGVEATKRWWAAGGWQVRREQVMSWEEEPHPGFRPVPHHHRSRVYILAATAE